MDQTMVRRLSAEFLGTFILVLGGCGSAVLAAKLFAPAPVEQLWLFWVAPIVSALVGGVVYGFVGRQIGGASGKHASADAA